MTLCAAGQEGNVSAAAVSSDPFIDCYQAWIKERAFSTGTAADFLESFTRTSGDLLIALQMQRIYMACMTGSRYAVKYTAGIHNLQ